MVKNGYAFDYPKYSKGKFSVYEKYAKNLSLGLWQMKFEYPWIWRKKNR
jgi:Micrococcal nuclease (thermonuclease) homologs